MTPRTPWWLLFVAPLAAALAGCIVPGAGSAPAAQAQPAGTARAATDPIARATTLSAPSPTVAALVVATAQPTPLPTATSAPTQTATPHPLTIAAMRAREYPGSDLVIEQTLAPGANYDRHIVSYRSDGLKIYALLTVPRGAKPPTGWPVVVFNHGYIPPAQYRTTERYIAYTDAFSRNGYILLRPDYRGHGSSEGRAGGGYSSPDYVVDVMNAMAAVQRWPDADPERVGMWGHSMGGFITLRAMVLSNAIKAGVIWGGVVGSFTDIAYNWGQAPRAGGLGAPPPNATPGRPLSWRDQMVVSYGSPAENPGFWAALSANTYLGDLSGPVQLHHGVADTSVPVRMSQTLDRQIREAGGTVELFTYPGDDHDISRNLGSALSRSVAFFDRYVKNR
jgi:dipeptidyl aminopeptidase/acylaminoacyl peptidase